MQGGDDRLTGKTHRMGGMLISLVGFIALNNRGLLVPDVNEGLQWLVMYPFCMWGSVASDLDHHWDSCPSKDIPSYLVHKALHITEPLNKMLDKTLSEKEKSCNKLYKVSKLFNAKHRSWQTHSELTVFMMLMFLYLALDGTFSIFNNNDLLLLRLMICGVCMGVISHFILDLLTPEGIWFASYTVFNRVICKGKLPSKFEKFHIVPKFKCFRTGSSWEKFIYTILKVLVIGCLIYIIGNYLFREQLDTLIAWFPYEITFNN